MKYLVIALLVSGCARGVGADAIPCDVEMVEEGLLVTCPNSVSLMPIEKEEELVSDDPVDNEIVCKRKRRHRHRHGK